LNPLLFEEVKLGKVSFSKVNQVSVKQSGNLFVRILHES